MELTHLTTLDNLAKALPKEGDYSLNAGEIGVFVKAIAGIKEEFRKAHSYTTQTEAGLLDAFLAAAITAGNDVPTAFRLAMQVMQARTQMVEQRVDILIAKEDSEEKEEAKEEAKEDSEETSNDNG